MSTTRLRLPIRLLFYREDGDWIAHSLEFDIVGDGPSKEAALRSFVDALSAQIEFLKDHNAMSSLFRPAEARLFQRFAEGNHVIDGTLKAILEEAISVNPMVERIDCREYIDVAERAA